jgi:hypothetical protein
LFSNRNAFSGYRITIDGMRASDVGVLMIGLIMAQYQLNDGLRRNHRDVGRHPRDRPTAHRHDRVDHRRLRAPRDRHGLRRLIKPTLTGLDSTGDLGRLSALLEQEYGDRAGPMLSGNALSLLRRAWPAPKP